MFKMSKKEFLHELLENYESETEFNRESLTECDDISTYKQVNFEIVNSILALKNLIPTNMFYLCVVFNGLINKYVFKIGSTGDIISKMTDINKSLNSNGFVYLVAFTDLISYVFKKKFMQIPELQKYSLGFHMFEINQTIYEIFIGCCSDEYFKLLNYKDVINLIC